MNQYLLVYNAALPCPALPSLSLPYLCTAISSTLNNSMPFYARFVWGNEEKQFGGKGFATGDKDKFFSPDFCSLPWFSISNSTAKCHARSKMVTFLSAHDGASAVPVQCQTPARTQLTSPMREYNSTTHEHGHIGCYACACRTQLMWCRENVRTVVKLFPGCPPVFLSLSPFRLDTNRFPPSSICYCSRNLLLFL